MSSLRSYVMVYLTTLVALGRTASGIVAMVETARGARKMTSKLMDWLPAHVSFANQHIMILYCADSSSSCHTTVPAYDALGQCWQDLFGEDSAAAPQFLSVDCASHPELCNAAEVQNFPSVVHYNQLREVTRWTGGRPGLLPWVRWNLGSVALKAGRNPHHCGGAKAPLPPALLIDDDATYWTNIGLLALIGIGSIWILNSGLGDDDETAQSASHKETILSASRYSGRQGFFGANMGQTMPPVIIRI